MAFKWDNWNNIQTCSAATDMEMVFDTLQKAILKIPKFFIDPVRGIR